MLYKGYVETKGKAIRMLMMTIFKQKDDKKTKKPMSLN